MASNGTSIRVDNDTHRLVKDIAFLQGETMTEVIEAAVKEYLGTRPDMQHRLTVVQKATSRAQGKDGTGSTPD